MKERERQRMKVKIEKKKRTMSLGNEKRIEKKSTRVNLKLNGKHGL
jgi:hypothetical protein